MAQHPIEGSERQPMEGATSIGRADPSERLEVSVILVRKGDAAMRERMGKLAADAEVGRHLTRPEFEAQFGADPNHIAAVRKFAGDHHLAVVQEHAGRRTVILSGTVGQVNEAFGVDLQRYRHPGGSYRGRVGSIHVPDELHGKVEAVLGLDNRPVARPHFRPRGANASRAVSYNPPQVAAMYGFPLGTGQGQCVAIIELGGGERSADLSTYFSQIGLRSAPNVTVVSVDQATNNPTTASSADGEVMLDIEVVGAVAPGANIAVYFTPNTDAGFLDAITTAIHDTTNKPSVISISWGGPESNWTQQAMTAMDNAFQAAATMGITVCVASGDNGSRDVPPGTRGAPGDHVDFPASSPHVLACGGTNLQGSGTSITSETVWNELPRGGAGGGVTVADDQASLRIGGGCGVVWNGVSALMKAEGR